MQNISRRKGFVVKLGEKLNKTSNSASVV